MKAAAAALLFAATVEPTLALAQAPDTDTLYQQAVRDRQAGRNAEAIAGLQQVLAARSDDVDARLNLGLALLAASRLDEADQAFAEVIARTPDYADAYVGRARVAQRRGDLATARAQAEKARTLRPADPEIAGLVGALSARERAATAGTGWRLDAGYAYSSLSKGLQPWRDASLALSRGLGDGRSVALALESSDHFGIRDNYFEGRFDQRLERGGFYLAVGGTPDAHHKPELAARAGGDWAVGSRGTILTLDGAVQRYVAGTVTSLHPGIDQALFGGKLVLGARWINVLDENDEYRSGYGVRAIWTPIDQLRLRAGYADAPESSEGVTVDVKSTSLGFDADLTDQLTLRVNGVHEERPAYDRDEIAVGFGWRF